MFDLYLYFIFFWLLFFKLFQLLYLLNLKHAFKKAHIKIKISQKNQMNVLIDTTCFIVFYHITSFIYNMLLCTLLSELLVILKK